MNRFGEQLDIFDMLDGDAPELDARGRPLRAASTLPIRGDETIVVTVWKYSEQIPAALNPVIECYCARCGRVLHPSWPAVSHKTPCPGCSLETGRIMRWHSNQLPDGWPSDAARRALPAEKEANEARWRDMLEPAGCTADLGPAPDGRRYCAIMAGTPADCHRTGTCPVYQPKDASQ